MPATLPSERLTRLILDYPNADNHTLATRYGVPVQLVERVGHANQLRKTDRQREERRRVATLARADANQVVELRPREPIMAAGDRCKGCGQLNWHWPGCPEIPNDDRPVGPPPR